MKKRTAMIMALVMTASTMFAGTAFAEAEAEEAAAEVVELSWDMVADKAAEVEGDFVTFDEIAVKIWVPAEMQAVELTEEDVENGYIGYFSNEEKGWNMAVVYANVEGMSIEEYTAELEGMDDVTEIEAGVVNGLPCVSYMMPENESANVAFATEQGYILEVTLAPTSDEEFGTYASLITCSIQAE